MKVIRQIKAVSVFDDSSEENKINLKNFDSTPGYYKTNIQPMLAIGHEGELLNYLKTIGVLQQHQDCDNVINEVPCNGVMTWVPAKIIDQYQLKCKKCSKRITIRNKSVFQDTRCHFRDIIRLLVGWCKGNDEESMSKLLCIKKQAVVKVYNIATQIANKNINSNISRWQLGGTQKVVLIDTYPEGLQKFEEPDNFLSINITPILCIMEIQRIPQRFWLRVLERYNVHNTQQIQNINLSALEVIKEIVVPGSILVTNSEAKLCSYDVLQSLKQLYPIIVSVEGLKRHDTVMNELLDNLEVIWQPAVNVCHEAYKYNNLQMQNFIINNLWRQQYEDEAFETLLNQMCYNFV